MPPEGHIVAVGGGAPIADYVLGLTGASDPLVTGLMTATGDHPAVLVRFYELFAGSRCRLERVELFGIPRPDLREVLLASDVVFVGGGNTASMLAVWRAHGVDAILREAWEHGAVLCGWSAGAICWFEVGVTDSFRAELDGMTCLGWLPGSCCPHYDGEAVRRPAYRRLVEHGFPGGYALDDACGLHFAGTELRAVLSWAEGARAYRVELDGDRVRETPLEPEFVAQSH